MLWDKIALTLTIVGALNWGSIGLFGFDLVAFLLGTVVWLFSRYKMCPSDKILIVYGNVGAGRSAKCIHGGATFIMPIVQSYAFMDLNPINIDVPLKGALSSQNIRVDVPSSFIVGISTQPEIIFPYKISQYPQIDQKLLENGIPIRSQQEYCKLIEDFLS